MLFALARGAMWLAGRAPLPMAKLVGELLGLLGWALVPRERRKALASLATAFPDESNRWHLSTARRCFAGLGRSAAEVCRLARGGATLRDWVLDYVSFPDEKVLQDVLAEGRGVVWVTGHVGNWELLAAGLGARGYRVRSFAKESYDPRFTDMIERWRLLMGVETIWRGRGGVSELVADTLRSGGILGVLMDQDTRVRGAFVPFFGRLAWTPTGAAELARQTGAPVLAGFVRRRSDGGHEISARRISLPFDGPEAEAIRSGTAMLTQAIEERVLEQPEDWVWMHQRWRTRPEEVATERADG